MTPPCNCEQALALTAEVTRLKAALAEADADVIRTSRNLHEVIDKLRAERDQYQAAYASACLASVDVVTEAVAGVDGLKNDRDNWRHIAREMEARGNAALAERAAARGEVASQGLAASEAIAKYAEDAAAARGEVERLKDAMEMGPRPEDVEPVAMAVNSRFGLYKGDAEYVEQWARQVQTWWNAIAHRMHARAALQSAPVQAPRLSAFFCCQEEWGQGRKCCPDCSHLESDSRTCTGCGGQGVSTNDSIMIGGPAKPAPAQAAACRLCGGGVTTDDSGLPCKRCGRTGVEPAAAPVQSAVDPTGHTLHDALMHAAYRNHQHLDACDGCRNVLRHAAALKAQAARCGPCDDGECGVHASARAPDPLCMCGHPRSDHARWKGSAGPADWLPCHDPDGCGDGCDKGCRNFTPATPDPQSKEPGR